MWNSIKNISLWLYLIGALFFAGWILVIAFDKGLEASLLYLLMAAVSLVSHLFFPRESFFHVLVLMPLMGWTGTTLPGLNIGLISGILSLNAALFTIRWMTGSDKRFDTIKILLFAFSFMAGLSTLFALYRIFSFSIQGIGGYMPYAFNPLAINSEDVLRHSLTLGANLFSWFGIYLGAREQWQNKGFPWYFSAITGVLLLTMVFQKFVDPWFLLPKGFPAEFRLNGTTSYAYGLGALIVFLGALLPLFFTRKRLVFLVVNLVMLVPIILWSGSRLALLTIPLMLVVYLVTWFIHAGRSEKPLPWKTILITGAASVVVLAAVITVSQNTAPEANETSFDRLVEHVGKDGLMGHLQRTRLNAYPLGFAIMSNYPLSGVGLGTYYAEVTKQIPLLMTEDYQLSDRFNIRSNAPSLYLALGTELGLPGLMIFLVLLFFSLFRGMRKKGLISRALLGGAVVVILAFNIGPELYNGEVIPLAMLLTASLAHRQTEQRVVKPVVALVVLAVVLQLGGMFISARDLSVANQWKELQWPMEEGFYRAEGEGRWTSDYASWLTTTQKSALLIEWHTGSTQAADFETTVRFYVNGELQETYAEPEPGAHHETLLKLPASEAGYSSISIRVRDPYIPAEHVDSDDRRPLGVFIHRVEQASAGSLHGGWGPEGSQHSQFYWLSDSGWFLTPPDATSLSLTVQAGHHNSAENPVFLRVYVNSRQVKELKFENREWRQVDIEVPENSSVNMVRLEASRTFRPDDRLKNGDKRELSFKVRFPGAEK